MPGPVLNLAFIYSEGIFNPGLLILTGKHTVRQYYKQHQNADSK